MVDRRLHMADPDASPRPGRVSRPPASQQPQHSADQLTRLGELLLARTDDVVARIAAVSAAAGVNLDETVEKRFRRTGALSTIAVAGWMAGDTLEAAREVGHEVWQIFGQLAAQRAASLTEVTKMCLRWRDAAGEVAGEIAAELDLSAEVLAQALLILRT